MKRELPGNYVLKTASPTGGKAGKGLNKTSTVQVIDSREMILLKHFRFKVGDPASLARAWAKAWKFYDEHKAKKGTKNA